MMGASSQCYQRGKELLRSFQVRLRCGPAGRRREVPRDAAARRLADIRAQPLSGGSEKAGTPGGPRKLSGACSKGQGCRKIWAISLQKLAEAYCQE